MAIGDASGGLPGRLFHDVVRCGIPERVAMDMAGHATRPVFDDTTLRAARTFRAPRGSSKRTSRRRLSKAFARIPSHWNGGNEPTRLERCRHSAPTWNRST